MSKKIVFSHIVCIGHNNAIGFNNRLLFSFKEDLDYFKSKTMGSVVVMGRLTYESIGKPLKGRINIVISKSSINEKGIFTVSSIDDAIELAKQMTDVINDKEVFIIGGESIYKQTMGLVDNIYVTKVISEPNVKADSYYPLISEDFGLVENSVLYQSEKGFIYGFERYARSSV